jgi:hypothetical protein
MSSSARSRGMEDGAPDGQAGNTGKRRRGERASPSNGTAQRPRSTRPAGSSRPTENAPSNASAASVGEPEDTLPRVAANDSGPMGGSPPTERDEPATPSTGGRPRRISLRRLRVAVARRLPRDRTGRPRRISLRRLRVAVARRLPRDRPLPSAPGTAVAAVAVAAIVAVGVATLVGALGGRGFTATPDPGTPTGLVAAETSATGGGDVAGPAIEETFDALPMDSRLAPPWVVTGEEASIVALPTSVDRSVRIRTSTDGDASSACRATDVAAGVAPRVGFDVLLGGRPGATVPLLALEAGDSPVLTIGVDAAGALVQFEPEPATTGTPGSAGAGSDGWRRVEVRLDSSRSTVEWLANDASGLEVAAGSAPIEAGTTVDELCLFSPEGAPSSWIAVDDLIVQG